MEALAFAEAFLLFGLCGFGGVFSIRSTTSSSRDSFLGVFGMTETNPFPTVEATVLRKLPATLERQIGRVGYLYTYLENCFTSMIAVILQLNKVEARLVVTSPRVQDRLTVVQDLLALKGIRLNFDFDGFREELKAINDQRNDVIHGLWLQLPGTRQIWLRITRGNWKKAQSHAPQVRRIIVPQANPVDADWCKEVAGQIVAATNKANRLGRAIDRLIATSPDRFRPPGPVVDPLGQRHKPKKRRARRSPSQESRKG